MAKAYKRLTVDEAQEIARQYFKENCAANLGEEIIHEMRDGFCFTSGSVTPGWRAVIGFEPERRAYYEFQLYKQTSECPYVERIYARLLVGRNRADVQCYAIWLPEVEPYDGPYFT
jgi:uncharacterized protein YciU (UPF0263 family)